MPKARPFAFLFLIFLVLGCASTRPEGSAGKIRWITFEELAASLQGAAPMAVGFDVDDTVLFSSPGFYYGMNKYSPGSARFMQSDTFWQEMNNQLDAFSLPKEIARRLIDLHKSRGDTIYFVTARPATPTEQLTPLLAKIFDIPNMHPVIFTGFAPGKNFKIEPLRQLRIRIFYGDSDGDIEAAQAAGARPVRIMRAGNTTYKPLPDYGALGEEVLRDSQF